MSKTAANSKVLNDLLNIYNAKGKSLFRENIRSGFSKSAKTRMLIRNFKNILKQ